MVSGRKIDSHIRSIGQECFSRFSHWIRLFRRGPKLRSFSTASANSSFSALSRSCRITGMLRVEVFSCDRMVCDPAYRARRGPYVGHTQQGAARERRYGNRMTNNVLCNICSGATFGAGPNGRMSVNGRLPRCCTCQSLERHVLACNELRLSYRKQSHRRNREGHIRRCPEQAMLSACPNTRTD